MNRSRFNRAVAGRLAVAVLAGAGAACLTVAVLEGTTQTVDDAVNRSFRERRAGGLRIAMAIVGAFGSELALSAITVAMAVVLLLFRRFRTCGFLLVSVLGAEALHVGLKVGIDRRRPRFEPTLLDVHSAGFPSGHAMMSMAVYLTLALLAARRIANRSGRVWIVAAAVLFSLLIGVSRLYAGVHYLSDVTAGWFAGLAWVALCDAGAVQMGGYKFIRSDAGRSFSPALRIAVPTVLSALRLVLAAVFPLAERGWQAAAVAAAGLSDWLDGLAARRFGVVSRWGAILDPVCDKIFTLTALVTLAVAGTLAVWQVVLLLARDMAVLLLASILAARGRRGALQTLAVRFPGKATTFGLFIFLTALLAWPEAAVLHTVLFALTAALSLAAAADYVLAALRSR